MAAHTRPTPTDPPKGTLMSLEAYLRLPETKPAREYDCGTVMRKAMGSTWHTYVQSLLDFAFRLFLRDHPIGEAGPELRCVFGSQGAERAYVPDFVFIAGASPGFGATNGSWYGPPTLAVEVLSPADRPSRIAHKVRVYLANGVLMVWVIDTERRLVTVYQPNHEPVMLGDEQFLSGSDVIPGFQVAISDILPPAPAPEGEPHQ